METPLHSINHSKGTIMANGNKMKPTCNVCGEHYSPKRKAAGYKTCLWCGEEEALQARRLWCVAPMHKSNYQLITNPADLKAINPKYNNADMKDYTESINTLGDAPW